MSVNSSRRLYNPQNQLTVLLLISNLYIEDETMKRPQKNILYFQIKLIIYTNPENSSQFIFINANHAKCSK